MIGEKNEIKIFIASPGDVLPEREAAYQVIEGINQTLRNMGRPFRLEVYAWEGRVHPDAGLPQEVIMKQIPIEECDVFIGIFWKRFGTPPGTCRPQDGRPYLSGTEEEIEKAFEARRNSPDDRPIIMLYRKTDPLPPSMTDDDYLQYARVIEFFRQCEPGGEHPALVGKFEGMQFRDLLNQHLWQVIREIEGRGEKKVKKVKTGKPPCAVARPAVSDVMARWLSLVGLRDHPFREYTACSRENLPHIFVSVGRCRLSELVDDPQSWVIFADEGCGKTTLRMMIATKCYPQDKNSLVFGVEIGASELETMIEWATSSEPVSRKRLGFPVPEPTSPRPDYSVTAKASRWAFAYAALISQNLPGEIPESPELNLDPYLLLKALVLTVRKAGFRQILCLVDEVDLLPSVRREPAKMADLLAQLMAPELREIKGIAFRYFLPAYVEDILYQRRSEFRLDRCRVEHLQWSPEDLKRLIRQRMIAFSERQGTPYQSLGELCEPAGEFVARINDELALLAEGNPRAAVYLADQLFRFHCQQEPVHRLIRPETWERVKAEWWVRGRAQILGPAGGEQGFYRWGDQIYYNGSPVNLSDRYHRLLWCLVQAGGRVCSRDDLARAGWPQDDPSGVTEGAIDEAMRRLRKKLAEQGIDPRWIETVRGRGYRLRNPQVISSEED